MVKVGTRARIAHRVWSTVSVGGKTWPMDMCSNKDAGRSQRETPTPSLCAQAHAGLPSKICFFATCNRTLHVEISCRIIFE